MSVMLLSIENVDLLLLWGGMMPAGSGMSTFIGCDKEPERECARRCEGALERSRRDSPKEHRGDERDGVRLLKGGRVEDMGGGLTE